MPVHSDYLPQILAANQSRQQTPFKYGSKLFALTLFRGACLSVAIYILFLLLCFDDTAWMLFPVLALLLCEFSISVPLWVFKNRWDALLSRGWLMFLIIGGMTYSYVCRPNLRTEDIDFFVSLLLAGYLALRIGSVIAIRTSLFNKILYKSKRLFPLADRIEFQNHTFYLLISIFTSLGMLAFFFVF